MFYSSLANHVLLAAKGVNQSQEEPELLSDEDENRKITAFEALKKLMNMIFNESIENVEHKKLKNKKQSDVRSFLRS